jgi:uncharacterized protein YdhG (YjbR/CyaY superfamily)
MEKAESVDAYIARFEPDVQAKLQQVRAAIREAAPQAAEIISYGMPAYRINYNLIYFAAAKSHVGLYPAAEAIVHFKDDIAAYKSSKGAIQLPYNEPVPVELIKRITEFRVAADAKAIMAKKKK